jgi:hypothetical protein
MVPLAANVPGTAHGIIISYGKKGPSRMHTFGKTPIILVLAILVAACSGSGIRMTPIHVEANPPAAPIQDVLIIVVIDNLEIRGIFEKHFKDWLAVKGVESDTSIDVLPIKDDNKLEKAAIAEAVDQYENDTVLITHLVGFAETEVFSRDRPQYYFNYYGFYNYAWGYVYWPTIYGEKVQFTLETGLYDVETESLIWAGESRLKNPKTTGQAIDQVVKAVIEELEKNGLLPRKP